MFSDTMVKLCFICSLLSTSAFSSELTSNNIDLSLSLKGGRQIFHDDISNELFSNYLWGIYTGLNLENNFSLDFGFQYHNLFDLQESNANVTWLVDLGVRYNHQLSKDFSAYTKVGLSYWNSSVIGGFSPLTEVGLTYELTPSFSISSAYQYIHEIGYKEGDLANGSSNFIFGLTYKFNSGIENEAIQPMNIIVNDNVQRPIVIPSQIEFYFDFDRSKCNCNLMSSDISAMLSFLESNPKYGIRVIGSTDVIGTELYNTNLSRKRALYIASLLRKNGFHVFDENIIGIGESAATMSSVEERKKDRKVIVKFFIL